jgi:molybdopterin-guanine dinucleotide biosynthesis protein A
MGRDKALLEFAGQTLQDRCAAVLRECFAEVLVIRQDDVPDLGPIGGLLTALRRVSTPALFLVACDMPFLDAGLIRQMAGELAGYDAVAMPGEPLHAAYATRILPVVERQIAAGHYSMNKLLSGLRVKEISVTGWRKTLTNVNTSEEWEAAKRYGQ